MINKIYSYNASFQNQRPSFEALQGKILQREMFYVEEGMSDYFRRNSKRGLSWCLNTYFDMMSEEEILKTLKMGPSQKAKCDRELDGFIKSSEKLSKTDFCKAFGQFLQERGIVDKDNFFQAFPARIIKIGKGNNTIRSDFRMLAASVDIKGATFDDEPVIANQLWLDGINNPNLDITADQMIVADSKLGRIKTKKDIFACGIEAKSIDAGTKVRIDGTTGDKADVPVKNKVVKIKAKEAEIGGIEAESVMGNTIYVKDTGNVIGKIRAYTMAIIDQVIAKTLTASELFIAPVKKRGNISIKQVKLGSDPRDISNAISQIRALAMNGYEHVEENTASIMPN